MARWFGLFGSGSQKNDVAEDAEQQGSKAFFLEPDDAKTMGDMNYMRTAKAVRKTFPKTAAWGDRFEAVEEVSALTKATSVDGVPLTPPPSPIVEPEAKAAPSFERRRADSSMDLFRKMAKDLNQ